MKRMTTATGHSNTTRQNVGCYHAASGGLNLGKSIRGWGKGYLGRGTLARSVEPSSTLLLTSSPTPES